MANVGQKSQNSEQKAPTSGGKKSIKDIHKELGFGPLAESKKGGYDDLDIDVALEKELAELDLVYRFINFKTFKKYGFHKQHWKPYRRASRPDNNVAFNIDPDGYMVRGDLVLAVKPKEWNLARKKELAEKNAKKADAIRDKTNEFRQVVAKSGIGQMVEDKD